MGIPRVAQCGMHAAGHEVAMVRRGDTARWTGVATCGSVWACPVCSAKVWARRGEELRQALDAWTEQGGRVAMVTLTMRHGRYDRLQSCWDALCDAWPASVGRSSGPRRAMAEAGVVGWVRRVECTWGQTHGWHLHVHALVFLPGDADDATVAGLGEAMFGAWSARLKRHGLTPIRDSGGLRAQLLDLDQARAEVAAYVAKSSPDGVAAELTGGGKVARGSNVSPWVILGGAVDGDDLALALWGE
jgi:hypothetical protein